MSDKEIQERDALIAKFSRVIDRATRPRKHDGRSKAPDYHKNYTKAKRAANKLKGLRADGKEYSKVNGHYKNRETTAEHRAAYCAGWSAGFLAGMRKERAKHPAA